MMDQKEEMKKNLLEELDDYFMQLVYLKDLLSVEEDICDSGEKLQCAPNFTLIVECALIDSYMIILATVYKGNIIKNLIMDCQSYTKYRPNETTGGIFVSWRRKEELPRGLD